jgi:hypothetical protein
MTPPSNPVDLTGALVELQATVLIALSARRGQKLTSEEATRLVRSHGLNGAVQAAKRKEGPKIFSWIPRSVRLFWR